MLTRIVDFEMKHLDMIDMRDLEKSASVPLDQLMELSIEAKTAFVDGEIMCCWGLLENGALWQIPSKRVMDNGMYYARRAIKVIRKLIKDKDVFSICLNDDLHKRWMRFIGFEPDYNYTYFIDGHEYVLFEVK